MKKMFVTIIAAMLAISSIAVAETPTDLVAEIPETEAVVEVIETPAEPAVETPAPVEETPVQATESAEATEAPAETEEIAEETAVPAETEESAETEATETVTDVIISETVETDQSLEIERKVSVHMILHGERLVAGETVTLAAELTGYEDVTTAFQWQRMVNGSWVNVAGATEQTYTFEVTSDMNGSTWQVLVTVVEK